MNKIWKQVIAGDDFQYWVGEILENGLFEGKLLNANNGEEVSRSTIVSAFTGNNLDGVFTITHAEDGGYEVGAYSNARLHGQITIFNSDDELEGSVTYFNGVKTHIDGQELSRLTSKTYIDRHSQQSSKRGEQVVAGIINTDGNTSRFIGNLRNGKILVSDFKEELLHGNYRETDESNGYSYSGEFINGYRSGMETCKDTGGWTSSTRFFSEGRLDGPEKHFTRLQDGLMVYYCMWKDGCKLMEIKYSSNGKVMSKTVYGDDDEERYVFIDLLKAVYNESKTADVQIELAEVLADKWNSHPKAKALKELTKTVDGLY